MDSQRIEKEAKAFFEWPTEDKSAVCTVGAILFAEHIARLATAEERDACAKVCEDLGHECHGEGRDDSEAFDCADRIRARSELCPII